MIFLLDTRSAGRASCSPKSAIPVGELIAGGHVLATAAINIGEVYAGMRRGEESRTEAFLSSLDCYPLTGRDRAPSRLAKECMGAERPDSLLSGHDGGGDRP